MAGSKSPPADRRQHQPTQRRCHMLALLIDVLIYPYVEDRSPAKLTRTYYYYYYFVQVGAAIYSTTGHQIRVRFG
jgi:hypothetical protein